ncbi:TPA: AlpA family phage regulatory protein [Yersinia enterocolitica]|uniref:helix-turn-helix transcriptional regulator n=1 Tax=Yersinia enterocolitica TaxID=630 RepID=UPI0021E7D75B|nr:AlpA family phage regulatory protein [Yersinia enterocolitica]EMA9490371.1 AlpA family phage regulatory protein [Yersinia enterocolitica]UYJ84113.1 AlpA family phage regulatory protein [Yersinia enterocolitica]UYK13491.1 AlpA family phage regulatory protein [Yersinia enterocolitica]HEN3585217.1 AlpA family phage regulatory protein [Yersinia enterocolitica]
MNKARLIKIEEVTRLCAMSRATLYRMLANNNFPPQVSVTGGRAVAWYEADVYKWINERPPKKKRNDI